MTAKRVRRAIMPPDTMMTDGSFRFQPAWHRYFTWQDDFSKDFAGKTMLDAAALDNADLSDLPGGATLAQVIVKVNTILAILRAG